MPMTAPMKPPPLAVLPGQVFRRHPWGNLPVPMQFLDPAATGRRRMRTKETPDLPAMPNHDP